MLNAKMHIYVQRYLQKQPSFELFKVQIKTLHDIKLEIAKKNGKETLHKIKWNEI